MSKKTRGKDFSKETDIQNDIRVALSERGIIVWRNNVGLAKFPNGSVVKYGLCNGSSDLIGISPNGRFIAIEVKVPEEEPDSDQENFIKVILRNGGIAGVAHSVEEALQLVMI